MRYEIIGVYLVGSKRRTEVVDTALTERSAQYLTAEYQLAFGPDWSVTYHERDTD